MIINNTFLRLLCFTLVAIGLAYQTMAEESRLKFNRDIRPILSENCFACHGFDEKSRQAELRLDLPEAAFADRDGMPPISPKNLEKSSVWQRIISVDPDEQMPPPSSHLELSTSEKETIRKWIEQGAGARSVANAPSYRCLHSRSTDQGKTCSQFESRSRNIASTRLL